MKPISGPIQITFRHMPPSAAVAQRVRAEVAKLTRYCEPILYCRVVIEAPHRHHRRGVRYHLRVDLGVPGNDIVVQHEPAEKLPLREVDLPRRTKRAETGGPRRDVYVEIRAVFDAARRQLEDYVRRRRGHVKLHLPADAPLPV